VLAALHGVGFVYFVLDLGPTLRRLRDGRVAWLVLGVALEARSLLREVVLFRGAFGRSGTRIGWRSSAEITLAGAVATKVVATAAAGGVAVTVWGLRAYGMTGAAVADGMVCCRIVTYGTYAAAVAIPGFGLWCGVFSGPAPVGLTLIPATFAAAVIVIALSMLIVDEPIREVSRAT
jgi:hypothetical protein